MGLQLQKRYVDSYKPSEETSQWYQGPSKTLTITFSESILGNKHSISFIAYPPKHGGQKDLRTDVQNLTDLLSICELSASPIEISLYKYGYRFYPNSWSRDIKLNYNENMRYNMQLSSEELPIRSLYVIGLPRHPYSYTEGIGGRRERLIAGAVKEAPGSDGSYKEYIYCVNLKVLKKIENPEHYFAIIRKEKQ